MNDSIVTLQDDSLTNTVRVFFLGMIFAFAISLSLSYLASEEISALGNYAVDCDNPASLAMAQDRSRNGIATPCE